MTWPRIGTVSGGMGLHCSVRLKEVSIDLSTPKPVCELHAIWKGEGKCLEFGQSIAVS